MALSLTVRTPALHAARSIPGWAAKVTLAELRKRGKDVPILFFTGQEVSDEERAQVQDVPYKPLAPVALLRSFERWLVLH